MDSNTACSSSRARIRIYDGGMGTTLLDHGLQVENPLWGTDLVITDPSAVLNVHRGFIDAGSDIIQTNTYQLTVKGLEQSSLSNDDPQAIFGQGIDLAQRAIALSSSPAGQLGIALSLGSIGSTLGSAQEYTGDYPPPYGPQGSSTIEKQIESMMNWHLDRLRLYAHTPGWSSVQWLAFETVPLVHEITAIRRGMYRLRNERFPKDFWITCPFPKGQFPAGGTPEDIIRAACAPEDGGGLAVEGIGLNCTHPRYVAALAKKFNLAYIVLAREGLVELGTTSMVLYPDGGMHMDTETRRLQNENMEARRWASDLAKTIHDLEAALGSDGRKIWKLIIVGGCCGTSYEHIKELRAAVDTLYDAAS